MSDNHRFIVLGTGAHFTCRVLETLVHASCPPLAYIQFTPHAHQHSHLTSINTAVEPRAELTTLLRSNAIPLYYQPQDGLATLIQKLNTDYLLVACWPELLADEVLNSVTTAALNLHPSLLPRFRGPDPVQAQLASDDKMFGITLHLMNEHYDTGDIVLQQELTVHERDKPAIEALAAEHGARLFIQAMNTYKDPGWSLTKQH